MSSLATSKGRRRLRERAEPARLRVASPWLGPASSQGRSRFGGSNRHPSEKIGTRIGPLASGRETTMAPHSFARGEPSSENHVRADPPTAASTPPSSISPPSTAGRRRSSSPPPAASSSKGEPPGRRAGRPVTRSDGRPSRLFFLRVGPRPSGHRGGRGPGVCWRMPTSMYWPPPVWWQWTASVFWPARSAALASSEMGNSS